MGVIARKSNRKVIFQELQKGHRVIERGILSILRYVGEAFAKEAKNNINPDGAWEQRVLSEYEKAKGKKQPTKGNYVDWTGNLRSSIGYFVLNDGAIISQKLEGKSEGIAAARAALSEVPNKKGYQLVGVAGMDYASHVESKGYNVITSQSVVALVDLKKSLIKFKDRLNKEGKIPGFDEGDLDMGFISQALNLN